MGRRAAQVLFVARVGVAAAVAVAGFEACTGVDSAPGAPEAARPGACEAYAPPSSFSPASPAVTFTADVMPLVVRSCAFTSCHGSETGPTGGLYLGSDLEATYANLVGVASTAVPSMARVAPGDPARSFLQHKIDGDACTIATCAGAATTAGSCAESMPQGQDLMAVNDRLVFRAWIAQGALSDLPLPQGAADAGLDAAPAADAREDTP
jgi:hypothetical protein